MDPVILNANVVNAVRKALPGDTDAIRFLSTILPLNKEALYRRMRGDVVFSFSEVCLIAKKLGISLDRFIETFSKENASFELVLQQFQEQDNKFKYINKFEQSLRHILADPDSRFELSHNLFPQVPTHLFYHLSKYNSFKWVYKNSILKAIPFKEVDYPQSVFQTHRDNNLATMKIKETSYIWDYTIIEMMVREIQYFASINLIDNEDIRILKEELHEFLNYVESLTKEGAFPTGNKIDIYISSTNSDAAYSYMESPHSKVCIIGVFDFQYLISMDDMAFNKTKAKIMSLKRGAVLISGSNEIYRISFFRKQHELIDSF